MNQTQCKISIVNRNVVIKRSMAGAIKHHGNKQKQ